MLLCYYLILSLATVGVGVGAVIGLLIVVLLPVTVVITVLCKRNNSPKHASNNESDQHIQLPPR